VKSKKAPSLSMLLIEAKRLPKAVPYVTADEVGHITDVLYEKGLTWKEIAAWFEQRGRKWSAQSIANAWRHWQTTKKRKK